MPRWQLDSEQPLTRHLYHVPNVARHHGHKTKMLCGRSCSWRRGTVLGAIEARGCACPCRSSWVSEEEGETREGRA